MNATTTKENTASSTEHKAGWLDALRAFAKGGDAESAALLATVEHVTDDEPIAITDDGRAALKAAAAAKEVHEFLVDLVTGFAESNQYSWFQVRNYEWHSPTLEGGTAAPHPLGWNTASGDVRNDRREEGRKSGPWMPLTTELVAKGLDRLRAGPIKHLSEETRARLIGCAAVLDAGNLDINDVDVIMQLAVLGEVIYG